ncbi:MAG: Gfo/Idh/MocA family oxidoreductase [Lachnospiraceae bacterium]|nr:Gfo/Idh/MocA family oxidoreductase [Lachnospiraceae bacterium]
MIKLGIIGMGNMGCQYARMILDGKVSGMEIAAVTRIRPERLERLKELQEKQVPRYESAKELYQAVQEGVLTLDAVLIVTPQMCHEEQVIEAFGLGLHVLCDKPSGVFSSQARHMNEVAGESGLVFSMMFHQRMNPIYQKMKEIVESEKYGKIKRVNWVITDWYRPDGYYDSVDWRGTWSKDGGGILLNQCPHNLDLLQWICGMPVQVQAFCKEGKYHKIEVEDEVTAYLEFAGGATGTFYATTGEAPGMNRLEISLEDALLVCEKGSLRVCELGFQEAEYRRTATNYFASLQGTWKEVACPGEDTMHKGVLQDFADSILEKKTPFVEGTEGLKSLLLSNAMYLSSWQKRMVELPCSAEEHLKFEETFKQEFREKQSGR